MDQATTETCACGSWLPAAQCCRIDLAALGRERAARPAGMGPPPLPPALMPKLVAARQAIHRGAFDDGGRLCLELLAAHSGHVESLWLLSRVHEAAGRWAAAESLLRQTVTREPNHIAATQALALAMFRRGNLDDAEVLARNAVRLAPAEFQSHNLMGMIMTERNRPRVGEHHYRRAIELAGRDAILLANLAWNLKNQGRIAEARSLYEESTRLKPKVLQTVVGWARMEEVDRNFERAHALLDTAQEFAPNEPMLLVSRAIVHGRSGDRDAALKLFDHIGAQRQNQALGPAELLEKGLLLDRMGRHDEAFACYEAGKRSIRELSGRDYLAAEARNLVERLARFFTAQRLKLLPRAGVRTDTAQPLFIVGFMRSGTTMLEQSLSAHRRISAGDELPLISDLAAMMPRMLASPMPYPEALADLWMGDKLEELDNLRDYYLQRARQLGVIGKAARWFTDKMPLNETHLGLIHLLFPKSPVVHLIRHPLDVMLSVFANAMTHGFLCAYSLEGAARHYMLIHELVEHYKRELEIRYMPVRYEDIVDQQEPTMRKVFAFVGEEFDRKALAFHENRRYARTASYAQVTEKLYSSSKFRYRRYMKHLAPIVPILKPAIQQLGYTVE